MALPKITLRQMIESGVHFGHHARRWNPKMAPFIYGKKDNIHIIDLQKTFPMFYTALNAAKEVAASGGKVLFVGTKRQAQELVKENAERCGQYYVNYRWLGGMMTNWKTVYKSISRLNKLNHMFEKNELGGYTKKEILKLQKEQERLARELSGIASMGGQPDLLFVIDTPKEDLAIKEAKKLGIPVIGIVDTNADPDAVDYPVPGNDDAIRAIQFYCESISLAIIDGMKAEIAAQGLKVEEMVGKHDAKIKKAPKAEEVKEEVAEEKKAKVEVVKKPAPKVVKAEEKVEEAVEEKPAKATKAKAEEKEEKAEPKKAATKKVEEKAEPKKATAKKAEEKAEPKKAVAAKKPAAKKAAK